MRRRIPGRATLGLIRLDGADGAMLHRLLGSQGWHAGARVRARFATDRAASIADIEGFEALTKGETP